MTKTCPYCITDIPEEATKCRHCGEWIANVDKLERINDAYRMGTPANRYGTVEREDPSALQPKFLLIMAGGLILFLIFVFGVLRPLVRSFHHERQDIKREIQQLNQTNRPGDVQER